MILMGRIRSCQMHHLTIVKYHGKMQEKESKFTLDIELHIIKDIMDEMKLSIHLSHHPSNHPSLHPSLYIIWRLSLADNRVFSAILPKSRQATQTHCLNLANSSFFFLFFSKKYGECSGSSFFLIPS
jgi:hypothetical protein